MIFLLKFFLPGDLAHNSFQFWEISLFKALIMYITALDFIVLNVARVIKLSFCTYTGINFCTTNISLSLTMGFQFLAYTFI